MDEPRPRSARFDVATCLLLLAVGAFQIWAATYYTVFDDEAFSCRLYTLPMGEMLNHLREGSDPDPPLYYLIENAWVHVAGVSPLMLRVPSILFFLIGCFLTSRAAGVWWGADAQRIALVITALHPAHLFFGFAARWYALAFCLIAAVNLLTARARRDRRLSASMALLWGVLAGAAMLTNYFLIAVVALHGLLLLVALRQQRQWTRAIIAGCLTVIVFIPWMGPFIGTLQIFRDSSPTGSITSTAARLLMVLLTGNLASPRAWWTWVAAGVFGFALVWRLLTTDLLRHSAFLLPLILLLLGIVTRTLIDKYAMTISGLCCIALTGLLVRYPARRRSPSPGGEGAPDEPHTQSHAPHDQPISTAGNNVAEPSNYFSRDVLIGSLAVMWLTCGAHLVSESFWSSWRWLDPMQDAIRTIRTKPKAKGNQPTITIASHPSARYYAAVASSPKASAWQQAWHNQQAAGVSGLRLPNAFVQQCATGDIPAEVVTIQTSGFVELPEWDTALDTLNRLYQPIDEKSYLKDPDAVLKDRLDPSIRHSPWRITVQHWRRSHAPTPQ